MKQSIANGKAMVVCMSRRICLALHNEIKNSGPDTIIKTTIKEP